MQIIECPKCQDEFYQEHVSRDNNPNLVTCKGCRYVFFVIVKLQYVKAKKQKDNTYTL